MKPPPLPWPLFAVIVGALLGGSLVAMLLSMGQQGEHAHAYAAAIDRGRTQARVADAIDDELQQRANEAGYRWAERQGLTDPAGCNSLDGAAQAGCLAWVAEQQQPLRGPAQH